MTQTGESIGAVVTEKVLANLADFWEHPVPGRFGDGIPRRIAGSQCDQQIPAGTQNPYWEIVRQLPVSAIEYHYQGRMDPDCHWFSPGEELRSFTDRHTLCMTFAWSIISPGDVAWIKSRLNSTGIVEPGAGHGYWAWQLAQAGIDVAAYEPADPEGNAFVLGDEPWFPVRRCDHTVVAEHPEHALLLCWPSYDKSWAAEALRAYEGSQLFYAGESWGGCTADDDFFGLLDTEWEEASTAPHHVTYSGIHCYLTEYQRKGGR